ncbi:MAG TPA: ABC transporter permease, partial [Candidatus Nanoarchaeia archaeon]|nr:ABC transporter permease [Candidatus Nanoarchaeia archaeon]
MFIDYVKFSLEGIKKRRLRSLLTMIGIFIGIAAVVSLISLGQGLSNTVEEQFAQLGGDKIMVSPGAQFGAFSSQTLTEDDLDVVKKTQGVDVATEMYYSSGKINFKGESKNTYIIGLPTDNTAKIITDMQNFDAEKGRELKEGDRYKITVGWRLWNKDFFEKSVGLRDKIQINGDEFEVVGLINKIGNPADDAQVYIPVETAKEIFDAEDEISMIYAQIKKGYEPDKVAEEIKENLRDSRKEEEGAESFSVQTFENILETFNSIFGVIQAVIIGIAAISLLVGGIGIMNTMYMSVMERTKEIGVMKAIGAKNSHILTIFLIESGIYGIIGGGIGVIIGIGIAKSVEFVAAQYLGTEMLKASMSPTLIIGALLFSFVVG